MAKFQSVDAYIGSFPQDVQIKLEAVRKTVHDVVPGSEERISYDIAAFRRNGRDYLSLAGWKRHISIYPIPGADEELDRELTPYKAGKGTLQFPLGEPIPLELVAKVARLLAEQRAGPT